MTTVIGLRSLVCLELAATIWLVMHRWRQHGFTWRGITLIIAAFFNALIPWIETPLLWWFAAAYVSALVVHIIVLLASPSRGQPYTPYTPAPTKKPEAIVHLVFVHLPIAENRVIDSTAIEIIDETHRIPLRKQGNHE